MMEKKTATHRDITQLITQLITKMFSVLSGILREEVDLVKPSAPKKIENNGLEMIKFVYAYDHEHARCASLIPLA